MIPDKENIKNILLIKLCCLGDMVFFTPVIENLRPNFPDAKITLLASGWLKPLIPYLKYIDEVIYYEGPYESSGIKKIINTLKIISTLRKNKYDLAVLGHRNNFYGFLAAISGIKYILGFAGTKFLTHSADFDKYTHITEKNLSMLEPLGIPMKSARTSLQYIKSKDELKKENNIPPGKKIIGVFPFGGINPGTDMDIKRWEFKNFLEVVNSLSNEDADTLILLFEGKGKSEKISHEIKFNSNVLIKDIDLIPVCDIFLCGDTGPLHMAAAFGIATVSLFGPSDADLLKPLGEEHITIWKKPYCSPCYNPVTAAERNNPKFWKNGVFYCHTGTWECMRGITVEEVIESVNKLKIKK